MAERPMPRINEITTMQIRVSDLAKTSPLFSMSVRAQQEQIANFLLINAPWLLELALAAATAEQCGRCDGHGRWWVITDCDSGEWRTCPMCGGTGVAAASETAENRRPDMAERPWAYLDDMRRAELPNWTKDLADTLDEWLFRMHGIASGGHHVGAFLQFAEDHHLAVAPRVAAASETREAGGQE